MHATPLSDYIIFLKRTVFEIVESRKSLDDTRVIFQLINAYIYKITLTRNGIINL